MPNELKPCPFCGCKYVFMRTTHRIDNVFNTQYEVYCSKCSARGGSRITEQTAREHWNRRLTMPEKEYIDRKAIPLKKFIKTAQMFSDDIICAIGTNFMENIAESENKELFEIIKAIQEAPTADVAEVKHGEWLIKETALGTCCICSVCGSCPTMEYRYCPYCGADMRGDKNG